MADFIVTYRHFFLEPIGVGPSFLYGWVSSSTLPFVGGGCGLVAAMVLTPLVGRVARQYDWLARPRRDRWHDRPVALLGGVAVLGAVAVGLAASGALTTYAWPVWLGALLVFSVGLADDLWDVHPEAKLLVQVVATALLLYAGHGFWRGGPFWVSIPVTFLWVIGITNAVNLIDGLDGLAASITAVAATALAVIGATTGQPGLATVAATLTGASVAFLLYNAKPARIFMGDCGSMLLGYLLAVVALSVQSTGEPVTATLVPIVVLALPIFDTTFVTVTRILGGRRVTAGGNDHTHHRLVRLGWSERDAVLGLSGASAFFALGALALLWTPAQLSMAVVLLALVACVIFGMYLVESPSYEPAASTRRPSFTERIGAVMRAVAGGVHWKSVGGIIADLLVIVAAFIVASHLRFGGTPPADQTALMIRALPGLVVLKVLVFYSFGLYHGIWRHAGTPEVVRLVKASTLASGLALAGWTSIFGTESVSLSVVILDWMIATGGVGGARFGFRALRQYFAAQRQDGRRALVYGSRGPGLLVLRHLRYRSDRTVVGLLDADATRHGLRGQGVDVLGGPGSLPEIVDAYEVDEVILPVENTSEDDRQILAEQCAEANVDCRHFAFVLQPAMHTDAVLESSTAENGTPAKSRSAVPAY